MSELRILTSKEWSFLEDFFAKLAEVEIACPILRNFESLPHRIGNDLDIFVRRSRLIEAEKILIDLVSQHNGELIKKFKKDTFTAWWIRIGDSPLLHIDLFNGAFYWRGRKLENDDIVCEGMKKTDMGFMIPRPAHQAFSMFITSLIWGGFYKSKYGKTIARLLSEKKERVCFEHMMRKNFSTAGRVPFAFEEIPDQSLVHQYVRALRRGVKWRWLTGMRFAELFSVARYWWWEVVNLWCPSGSWALVVGDQDAAVEELLKSEIVEIHGSEAIMRYKEKGVINWLWFRLRHIQRRMARNELVVVRAQVTCAQRLMLRIGGKADFLIMNQNILDSVCYLRHYKKSNLSQSVWAKVSANKPY